MNKELGLRIAMGMGLVVAILIGMIIGGSSSLAYWDVSGYQLQSGQNYTDTCNSLNISKTLCSSIIQMLHPSGVPCPDLWGPARYDWKCCNNYDGAYDPNCDD